MNRLLKLTFMVSLLLSAFTIELCAQGGGVVVSGRVVDQDGQSIIGASVVDQSISRGAVTGVDGDFKLEVTSNESQLTISFMGYKTVKIRAGLVVASKPIVLFDDAQSLEEVVVIGYGSVKKTDLSGSVVAIKAEDTNKGAVTSPQELIQGKVPGLSVLSGDGAPGAGSTIRIRSGASLNASNDPLIVIDGIPVANDAVPGTPNALATINPSDIDTFTVLKDASATAIYGSRASNGVIIITTKKGANSGLKVSYNSTYAVKDPYRRIDVMSGNEYRDAILGQYLEGSDQGDAVRAILNQYPEQSTDWQDAIYQLGLSTDQNVAISGKAGFMPFRVSAGYNNEQGTIKTSSYERYTGSLNMSPKFLNDHLSVDLNIKGTINNNRFADPGAVGAAIYYDPTKPIYADDQYGYGGYYNWTSIIGGVASPNTQASVNPLSLLYHNNNTGSTMRSLGNVQVDYKIHGLEDLHLNMNLGYDIAESDGNSYVTQESFQAAKDGEFMGIGRGNTWNNRRKNNLLDMYANYNKELVSIKSNIDVMAGYSWQHFYYSNMDIGKSNITESLGEMKGWTYSDAEGRYILDDSRRIPYENYLVSVFGRVNYSLMDRYLLTLTLRRDGSSRFSENNRWGMFPSTALAWNIADESFMSGTKDVLSSLKLRVGYGVTGQQEIGDYMYITKYVGSNNANSNYLGSSLLRPDGYSPDLKWEQTSTYNVGVDYGFLKNRINGSIEYYQKYTEDLLNTISAPAGTNFTNQVLANVGTMKNEGIEFHINAVAINTKDFSWDLGYNVTWNKSVITKLTANYNPDYEGIVAANAPGTFGTGVVLSRHQVGASPYNFWLFEQVYDESGNPIQNAVVDRNGDGQITSSDRYFTNKSPLADFYMGFSSQFRYQSWDLGFNLRASIGNYAFNAANAGNSSLNSFSNQGSLSNYNQTAIEYAGFTHLNTIEQKTSDLFLEDASFLKMDNITLGYSFDKIAGAKISGRLSGSVQNVFTITKYTGLDPEISSINGIDDAMWPRPRTFTMGLSLNF